MPSSLTELESRRAAIRREIDQLGDLRPGSITPTSGRCGKPNCRCHQPGQPPHGPNLRFTFKVGGKTHSESLPTPMAVLKAQREIAEFQKFQTLSQEFVEVSAAICRSRPVEEEFSSTQEKKLSTRSTRKSRAK